MTHASDRPALPTRRRCLAALGAGALAVALPAGAMAQSYPTRPIRVVVPFPPGGPNDVLARLLSTELSKLLGQAIVIDNRGGAGGTLGTDAVAKAANDGYTLLLSGTASLSISPSLYDNLPYDAVKDFAPISLVGTSPSVLVAHPSLPVKNVQDLIKLAREKPGELNVASAGIGSAAHLAAALFLDQAGIDVVHVPYRGGGPALNDLLAGQVDFYFSGIASVLPLLADKRLNALAVTGKTRTESMPDLPTVDESGVPGYEFQNWYAMVAPAGSPDAAIEAVNRGIAQVLAMPSVREKLQELAVDPVVSSPQELGDYQRQEIEKWSNLVRSAGITAD